MVLQIVDRMAGAFDGTHYLPVYTG
jgi:hypothetical protein